MLRDFSTWLSTLDTSNGTKNKDGAGDNDIFLCFSLHFSMNLKLHLKIKSRRKKKEGSQEGSREVMEILNNEISKLNRRISETKEKLHFKQK